MAYATFSDLPPEMVGNVFAFVRAKPDQGAVCLVSHTWRDIMAPLMWEILRTDFRTASPPQIARLLHPTSGILSHVRELDILNSVCSTDGDSRLRQVISAIRSDRIRRFQSDVRISFFTTQLLLQSHRKIEDLDIWKDSSQMFEGTTSRRLAFSQHFKWMGPLLPEITRIHMDITGLVEGSFPNAASVSRYCRKLRELSIGCGLHPQTKTCLSAMLDQAIQLSFLKNLTCLRIHNIDLVSNGGQNICGHFNLSKLRELRLEECDYLIHFLDGLSSFYSHSTGDLEYLKIHLPEEYVEPKNTKLAISKLLKVCPKLHVLDLDMTMGEPLIGHDCIPAHRQTLHTLILGTGLSGLCLSVPAMKAILEACTGLRWLVINMPRQDLGRLTKFGSDFIMNKDFKNTLDALSPHKALKALRILNPPSIYVDDGDEDLTEEDMVNRHVPFCQIIMQNYANRILRYMVARGSDVNILSFRPHNMDVLEGPEQMNKDANGHQWPRYEYIRGRVSDVTGTDAVVAIPSPDVSLDFPDLATFL